MAIAISSSDDAKQMRLALHQVVTIGPDFLSGSVDADTMAITMADAARDYQSHYVAATGQPGRLPEPLDREAAELRAALVEIHTCGTGYLANRCDADCVARTMTQILGEFGELV